MHRAFCDASGDRQRLRWAHAVNCESHLRAALDDPAVDALEADVCTLPSSDGERKPYIAHPPAVTADITAERFIDIVRQSHTKKIVKLDLKCDDVIAEVVDLLLLSGIAAVTPLVLNADVISTSGNPAPVCAETLLSHHARFDNVTIPPVVSLGWCPPSGGDATLSTLNISQMAALARGRAATLAVRADVALRSQRQLEGLLGDLPGCGLTLWAHPGDPVCPETLRRWVDSLGTRQVWVDVPQEMFPDS
ncbi:protein FAM151A-like [Amphibalanus amphitrite]|uniref:protein FAM151A-like n=1 Tax=Amphibalanus amphitrite TaxID=1232801 RepID=UPI001C91103B|nr:protein FAM151A-like [Amphibalanus amphitrite]XP_043206345.1 protein FAM151A-like [Amphibalanus amphitrite]